MPLRLRESIAQVAQLPSDKGVLAGRIELLPARHREMMRTIFIDGQSANRVARLMGVPARTLQRRAARLGRTIASRRFGRVAKAIPFLPAPDATIARRHFCQQASCRSLARELGLSAYALRQRIAVVKAEIEAINKIMTPAERKVSSISDLGSSI